MRLSIDKMWMESVSIQISCCFVHQMDSFGLLGRGARRFASPPL
jgi:hypothetical protein